MLIGGAKQDHIGIDRVSQSRFGQAGCIEQPRALLQPCGKCQVQISARDCESGVAGEFPCYDFVTIDHSAACGRHETQSAALGRDHKVTANQRIAFAQSHTNGGNIFRRLTDAAVNMHRAALLGQTSHFHNTRRLAI